MGLGGFLSSSALMGCPPGLSRLAREVLLSLLARKSSLEVLVR